MTPVDMAPLVNIGAVGVVLAWFMLRGEKKMEELAKAVDRQSDEMIKAINRLSMAHALDVLSRDSAPAGVKRQAQAIVTEIQAQGGAGGAS